MLLQNQAAQRSSELTQLGEDVIRYRIESSQWEQKSQAQLNLDCFKDEQVRAQLSEHPHCGLTLQFKGHTLLRSFPECEFGTLGQKWAMSFGNYSGHFD